ncbi:FRG domain-containing protein [Xanthobacter sp. DSM 14520]|uniref:FRG domain-containing protein n=1 Tax=Xanthobacter autotrophicus (strain ATCC BAA-1158 / Py2) TaxID=78245 RepID=UPI00372B1322
MSFNDFFSAVEEARRRTGTTRGGAWYRGISDGRHQLLPSLLRYPNRHPDAEINMFANFWTMVEDVSIADNWERLSFMQHYGVPTRLLDWTTDLNAAMYFAIANSDRRGTGDPWIWVLNPYKLNEMFCKERRIFDAVDRVGFDYYDAAIAQRKGAHFPNQQPIAMRPMWSNRRIRLQSGCFTFHGAEEPLEAAVSSRIAKRVPIPHRAVDEMRRKLTAEGINSMRLFGGVEGLATYIRRSHLN